MTSYYVFSALAAQREDEIERQALLAQRERARHQAAALAPRPRRSRRRIGWHGRRHLHLV